MLASVTALVLLVLVASVIALVLLALQRIRAERALLRVLSDHTLEGVVGVLCGLALVALVTTMLNLSTGRGWAGVVQTVQWQYDELMAGPGPSVSTLAAEDPRPKCAQLAPRPDVLALNVTVVGATTQTDQNWLRSTFIESLGACEYDALTTRVVIVEVSPLPAVLPNVSAAQAIVSVETNGSESQSDKFYIRGVGRGTEPRLAQASAVAAAAGELASRWAQK